MAHNEITTQEPAKEASMKNDISKNYVRGLRLGVLQSVFESCSSQHPGNGPA
jgi:hypothetical protein